MNIWKRNVRLGVALVGIGLLSSVTLLARDGAGSGGGGGGLTEQGKLKLREFVEGTTCDWADGPHFFGTYLPPGAQVRGTDQVLSKKIGFLFYFLLQDPQVVEAYYAETVNLNVCLSSKPLRQLPEDVKESIGAYTGPSGTQIAIRIGNDLFVDKAAFDALDETNQEYLKFHEILHAYIPMDVPARMTKLRDFVAGVRKIDLAFPRRENGNYSYDLSDEFRALMNEQRGKYLALKANNNVDFNLSQKTVSPELQLVQRHITNGDVTALAYTLKRYSIDVNSQGRSGNTLFHELIFQISECITSDPRPMCANSLKLVQLYLANGANPDLFYSTGEWQPMAVWFYLLKSMNRTGRQNRLEWADAIFKKKIEKAGGLTEDLKSLAGTALLLLAQDNYMGDSMHQVLQWGADVNATDDEGRTALIVAVEKKGHGNNLFAAVPATYLIGVLLVHGADDTVKNAEGKTALEIMRDFKGPLRELYDSKAMYELGVKALEAGPKGIDALRPEFEKLGMKLPKVP